VIDHQPDPYEALELLRVLRKALGLADQPADLTGKGIPRKDEGTETPLHPFPALTSSLYFLRVLAVAIELRCRGTRRFTHSPLLVTGEAEV
jgi:hypothetical protein